MHSKALILMGGAGLVICSIVLFRHFRRPSLEDTVLRAWDCIQQQNSPCLLGLMSDEEKRAYAMDERKLKSMLSTYVSDVLSSSQGGDVHLESAGPDSVLLDVPRTMTDGKTTRFSLVATRINTGIVCPALVTGLLLTCFDAKYREPGTGASGSSKLALWEKAAVRERDTLTNFGINGIFRSPEEGLLTWDMWIEHCRKGIARAEEQRRSQDTSG